ncbi:ECF transporter S component [Solicola gregarius]|uniref:ECF transporter S component n=1 Tax=Solicola gregarius TaxID=2908642 RepID=A0AA46TLE5_9ACTN|nr:ECF transporter S component [Solicola gregarius]UYM07067.1 ECF transporter S component [Solicola gregarius]
MSSATTSRAIGYGSRFAYRTVDIVTVAMLGVAVGVAFWGWDQLHAVIGAATNAFPPSGGLLAGPWLLGGVIGGLVVRKPGAAMACELIAANVEYLLGNQWGGSVMVSGLLQGLGVEIVLAIFLYKRFGFVVAGLAGALAGAIESVYEWYSYFPDWEFGYRLAYLAMFAFSGAVVAGVGGWALVRALAATGALDAFAAGREHHERNAS